MIIVLVKQRSWRIGSCLLGACLTLDSSIYIRISFCYIICATKSLHSASSCVLLYDRIPSLIPHCSFASMDRSLDEVISERQVRPRCVHQSTRALLIEDSLAHLAAAGPTVVMTFPAMAYKRLLMRFPVPSEVATNSFTPGATTSLFPLLTHFSTGYNMPLNSPSVPSRRHLWSLG